MSALFNSGYRILSIASNSTTYMSCPSLSIVSPSQEYSHNSGVHRGSLSNLPWSSITAPTGKAKYSANSSFVHGFVSAALKLQLVRVRNSPSSQA